MTTFILIMTIAIRGPAVSIASVPGFSGYAECQTAGQQWAEVAKPPGGAANFVCVEQKK